MKKENYTNIPEELLNEFKDMAETYRLWRDNTSDDLYYTNMRILLEDADRMQIDIDIHPQIEEMCKKLKRAIIDQAESIRKANESEKLIGSIYMDLYAIDRAKREL